MKPTEATLDRALRELTATSRNRLPSALYRWTRALVHEGAPAEHYVRIREAAVSRGLDPAAAELITNAGERARDQREDQAEADQRRDRR